MRLSLIILAILVIGVPAVGIDLLPDDAAFSKTITLNLRGEALSDVAKILSKVSEVNIRASRDTADQKITILVDKMPLKDVMNGIATLFGWSWTVKTDNDGNDTYIIYDPLRQQREADRKDALDKAWKALGTKLDSLAYDVESADNFYETLTLQQYRSLSPELRNAYLSGMRICYNMESPEIAWHPSQIVMDEFANAGSRMQKLTFKAREDWSAWDPDSTKPDNVRIEMYTDVNANTITAKSKEYIDYRHPDSNEKNSMTLCVGGECKLCTQEIDYPSETLENTLPDKPTDGLLGEIVSITATDLLAEGAVVEKETGTCQATRTDLLAALHKKFGFQIISDYYSSWGQFKDIQDITIKQLLDGKSVPGFPADWGWNGNILYSRVKDIRTADSQEVPNRFLRPWQAVVKKHGYRGLEEMAQAAAFLSDEQRQAISKNCRFLKLGECKEIDNVGGWDNALLRFYGMLTPKQKTNLFTSEVGVLELTLAQRNALAALLYSTNFTHVGVYNNDGLNVNEPHVILGPLGTPAVKLQMTCSGSFIYLNPGDDVESRILRTLAVATTPEEALLMARNWLGKDGDPQNVVAKNDIIYTLAVRYEGYTNNEPVPNFEGWINTTAHSSYHRVKIKIPENKPRVN